MSKIKCIIGLFLLISTFIFPVVVHAETQNPGLTPGEPPKLERTLEDSDASLRASEHRVLSGDNILNNLFERPFTAIEMVYQPELDIQTVDFAVLDQFFYFTITLKGMDLAGSALYGIEFDRSKTGRGDLIVLTKVPGKKWSMDNITVMTDQNGDVGGINPIIADEDFKGNGYDTQIEIGKDKVAFSRISPDDPHAVQIAVSLALLDNPMEFLYGAWVDNGLKKFSMFDYNDYQGPSEAGSPFKDNEDYPIKGLFSLDNTCRLPFGFSQESSTVPGTCINIAPAVAGGCNRYCVQRCAANQGCCVWGCR